MSCDQLAAQPLRRLVLLIEEPEQLHRPGALQLEAVLQTVSQRRVAADDRLKDADQAWRRLRLSSTRPAEEADDHRMFPGHAEQQEAGEREDGDVHVTALPRAGRTARAR